MTPAERTRLRVLIDEARRSRLPRAQRREDAPFNEVDGVRYCSYCGAVLPLDRTKPSNVARRRFCSSTHRANYGRRERLRRAAEGRMVERA